MATTDASPCYRTILVIEDDDDIRDAYTMLLEDAGYAVVDASDGVIGLEKLKTLPRPCLILLDMMMPRMNGLEFLEAMSSEDALAPIPVVVVSAYSHLSADVAGRVAAFVKKPVTANELFSWVRQFCGSSSA